MEAAISESDTPKGPDSASVASKPDGPVAAAILATGIGAFALGLFVILAEASTGMKDFLQLSERVGPLSGKTIFAVLAYLAGWGVLGTLWKDRDMDLGPIVKVTAVLVGLGLLMTFPPIFLLFESE